MRSSPLWQDPTISPETWFTIPSPCFYRAWLCKWNWWRPQPRVTESSGIIGDLQCLPSHSVILLSSQHAPGRDSLRLQLSSSCCSPQPQTKNDSPPGSPLSLTPAFTVREALYGSDGASKDKAVMCRKAHLRGGWQGIMGRSGVGKGRKENVYSESCWWDFSQLITHKNDSLLTLLCSLIFHIILFTAPSASSTKVKWREW